VAVNGGRCCGPSIWRRRNPWRSLHCISPLSLYNLCSSHPPLKDVESQLEKLKKYSTIIRVLAHTQVEEVFRLSEFG